MLHYNLASECLDTARQEDMSYRILDDYKLDFGFQFHIFACTKHKSWQLELAGPPKHRKTPFTIAQKKLYVVDLQQLVCNNNIVHIITVVTKMVKMEKLERGKFLVFK